MCRLLGIAPRAGNIVDFSVIRSFRNLASYGNVCEGSDPGHGDGWGIVAWYQDKPLYLGREPKDAFTDPLFEEACVKGEAMEVASPVIAHLRKASVGLKIRDNTHPFVQDGWAFAHNGTIRKLNLKYTTDSQWFFESVLQDYKRNGCDIVGAISRNVKIVREVHPYSSLTFLLSNGREFYAYRDCTANIDYYTLYYASTPGGFMISQEKFFDAPWELLDNGSLLKLNQDMSFEILPILPEIQPKAV
jgi:predicted glutamine amidotransferase